MLHFLSFFLHRKVRKNFLKRLPLFSFKTSNWKRIIPQHQHRQGVRTLTQSNVVLTAAQLTRPRQAETTLSCVKVRTPCWWSCCRIIRFQLLVFNYVTYPISDRNWTRVSERYVQNRSDQPILVLVQLLIRRFFAQLVHHQRKTITKKQTQIHHTVVIDLKVRIFVWSWIQSHKI